MIGNSIDESLLTGSKWRIIAALAKLHNATPKMLSAEAKTTLPNISQTIKLLEAHDLLRSKKQEKNHSSGKPTKSYSLKKEFVHVISCTREKQYTKTITMDRWKKILFNSIIEKDGEYIIKLFCDYEDILGLITAISFSESTKDEIHLFVITDHVDKIRRDYANLYITFQGRNKKIVIWSHTELEVVEGLLKGEDYFKNFMKKLNIIFDDQGVFMRIIKRWDSKTEDGYEE